MVALAVGVLAAAPSVSAFSPEPVRRVRGIIDRDEVWSGAVRIIGDLQIAEGTVRVEPGTQIEFYGGRDREGIELVVGSADRGTGRLALEGSAERPIVIRTRRGAGVGAIKVYLHGAGGMDSPLKINGTAVQPKEAAACLWRHVRFEGLGGAPRTGGGVSPGLSFVLNGAEAALALEHCRFNDCARVLVEMIPSAPVAISACHFLSGREAIEVEVRGDTEDARAPAVRIVRNRLDGGLSVRGCAARLEENLVVGRAATVFVAACRGARVSDNYIYNTTAKDEGRCCFECPDGDVEVRGNVFRGGSDCVLAGGRVMRENLVVAAPLVDARGRPAHTRRLVAALPPGALFERNVLIGPAESMVVASPRQMEAAGQATATVLRWNVFDGVSRTARGVDLLGFAGPRGKTTAYNNVFLRMTAAFLFKGRGGGLQADYNAGRRETLFYRMAPVSLVADGAGSMGRHSVCAEDAAALRLRGPLPREAGFFEGLEIERFEDIAAERERVFGFYRPRSSSPLLGAGRADDGGKSVPIGLEGAIGAWAARKRPAK